MVRPPPPSPSPAGHGTQFTQQFLSSVLSQRGPESLPYTEDVKWLIRQHLVALAEAIPSLQPKSASFTHNDGRTVHLLQADGTIPMYYAEAVYNIPVVIWLLEPYPRAAPCVYLAPTRDMVVKRGHPHVNPSGLVSAPYLLSWVFPSSNLVDLARSLSHLFARDPPLFSRQPPRPTVTNPPNPNPHPNPDSAFPPPPSYPRFRPPPTEDAAEVFRRNAIAKIAEAAHGEVSAMRKAREAEMEAMFAAQGVLRRREEEVAAGVRGLLEEKEGLEQQLQIVLMNSDLLEGWVRENEGKVVERGGEFEVEAAFETIDGLSKQLLESTAADLAVEDLIYSLDTAVQEGAIPFDSYLKNVRALSRDQFFHRTMANKVRATQMQAQVAAMAARSSHYAS